MVCQLKESTAAPEPLTVSDRLGRRIAKLGGRASRMLHKASTDPLSLVQRIASASTQALAKPRAKSARELRPEQRLGAATVDPRSLVRRGSAAPQHAARTPPARPPLDLRPGERVRVRSVADIRATLDQDGRLRGLAYMPEMQRFAGRELSVKKRVELFFDERTREMCKVKGIVLLDGAFCEGRSSDPTDYGGCDRCCFLFWKEDWLERVVS